MEGTDESLDVSKRSMGKHRADLRPTKPRLEHRALDLHIRGTTLWEGASDRLLYSPEVVHHPISPALSIRICLSRCLYTLRMMGLPLIATIRISTNWLAIRVQKSCYPVYIWPPFQSHRRTASHATFRDPQLLQYLTKRDLHLLTSAAKYGPQER